MLDQFLFLRAFVSSCEPKPFGFTLITLIRLDSDPAPDAALARPALIPIPNTAALT